MPHIPMEYTVDLGKTINVTPLHTLFAMGDDNAHRFAFSVVQDGKPVDLSGCTVLATYTNFSPHGMTVKLDGKIEDGKAVALLSKACYTMEGRFAIVVRLKNSSGTSAIFYGDGYMIRTTADTVIDGDYIIYDVNTLLEKIAEINEATSSANAAAQSANTAAETANAAASNAQEKADMANTAAQGASGWANATMSATGLPAGSAPTATVTTASDGHKVITLGIPKGDTGATPQISVQVETGAAGSDASVSVSGTAENPVIHLTIPRGDTGAIENLTINGKTPDASGTVTLGMSDISGLSDAIANAGGVKTVAGVSPDSTGNVALTAANVGAVPTSRTVNGKALSENISLAASDVGALKDSGEALHQFAQTTGTGNYWGLEQSVTAIIDTYSAIGIRFFGESAQRVSRDAEGSYRGYTIYDTGNKPTASDVGAVPTSRKVNGKALSADITGGVVGVAEVSVTSESISSGSTGTGTVTFSAMTGASKYYAVLLVSGSIYGWVTSVSISGTTLTATYYNNSSSTHTIGSKFLIIGIA